MDWQDIAKIIMNNAPTLGALVGSVIPGAGTAAGGAIGIGIKTIASAFGLSEDATPEAIDAAIKADPQAELKLRLAEMDYRVKMRDLDIEEMRVEMVPYLKELDTKTVPWVDALHKMSRTMLSFFCIAATVILLLTNHEITPSVALILGGPATAYTLIKGKGNQTKIWGKEVH